MTTPHLTEPGTGAEGLDPGTAMKALIDSGLTAEQILTTLTKVMPAAGRLSYAGKVVPTVSVVLAAVRTSITNRGTLGTWAPHLNRLEAVHGDDLVDMVDYNDLKALETLARAEALARPRRCNANGDGAAESHIDAMRFVFNHVERSRYRADNPAKHLKKPKRRRSPRRALESDEMAVVWAITCNGGNDPELDAILVRLARECGARREGAINLTIGGIDLVNQLVTLHEKFGKIRIVPITRGLAEAILALARARGAKGPGDRALRYRPRFSEKGVGRPLTRKRFETWAKRVQNDLPATVTVNVSYHWIRHTAGRSIERIGGQSVAAEFLGHEHPGSVTFTYTRACAIEVINAWSIMVGEQHPLATVTVAADDSTPDD